MFMVGVRFTYDLVQLVRVIYKYQKGLEIAPPPQSCMRIAYYCTLVVILTYPIVIDCIVEPESKETIVESILIATAYCIYTVCSIQAILMLILVIIIRR